MNRTMPDSEALQVGGDRVADVTTMRLALETVDAVAAEVAKTPDLGDLLPAVLRIIVEAVRADAAIIRLLDPRRTTLLPAATLGFPDDYAGAFTPLPVDDASFSGRAIRTGRIQTIASAKEFATVSQPMRERGIVSIVCVPLVADGWPVGTIALGSRITGHFGTHAERLLATVAHHLATAVARAQLFEAVARTKNDWEQLFDAMADGVAICGPDAQLMRVNRAFAGLFGGDVRVMVPSRCPLGVPHDGKGEGGQEIDGHRPGQRLVVNTLPLRNSGELAPRLLHVIRDVTAEREADRALRRQNALLEEARAEAELFGEIAHSIATSLRQEELLDRLVEAGSRFVGVDHCAIALPDPEAAELVGAAMNGGRTGLFRKVRLPLDAPFASAAAWRERRTVVVEDFLGTDEFLRDVTVQFGVRSAIFVPLLGPLAAVGVMVFSRAVLPGAFPPDTIRRAQRLGAHAALAIENARLHRELAEHAARMEARVRERTEALETAGRHKSDFLSHMSHELRTPLNAIMGFSGMLLEGHGGPLEAKGRRYADQIQRGGRHLLALINDVLDLSRVEAGRLELHPERVAVSAALAGAEELVRGLAATRGVIVTAHIPEGDLMLRADAVRLHQMITNLLSNAVKFTPAGGRVTVRATPQGRDAAGRPPGAEGEWIEIAVSDTGVGIAPEDIGRLFRPFEQLGNRLRRSHDGTGLGLALTRQLAEVHGGTVRAESPGLGHGSTFTLILPAGGGPSGRTVALVEDDPAVQEMVAEILREAGHAVRRADTAAAGAELLAGRPDLLILDLGLPDRRGQELLADLRADAATKNLPVLAMSGSPDVTAADMRAAGADDFLTKPFSTTVLRDTVARLLKRTALP